MPGKLLPKAYTDSIKKWLPRVLDASLMPAELDPNSWVGVRKLYYGRNFILGRFSSRDGLNTVVEVKGTYRILDITIRSKRLFAKSATDMTTDEIKGVLTTVLRDPGREGGQDRVEESGRETRWC